MPVIGFLSSRALDDSSAHLAVFRQGLKEAGQAVEPRPGCSDFLAGDGLALAVACMRSSMTLKGSCGAEISRLIPAICSHHSAEYLPPITASRLRINIIPIVSITEARLCTETPRVELWNRFLSSISPTLSMPERRTNGAGMGCSAYHINIHGELSLIPLLD